MNRQVMPDVVEVLFPKALVNAFVVEADVLTLIDTGTPGGVPAMLGAIRQLGRDPVEVERIILTHRHADHAANAAELAAITGAEVHVSPDDAPFVRDGLEQPRPKVATPLGHALVPYVKVALPWSLPPCHAGAADAGRRRPRRAVPCDRHPRPHRRPRVPAVGGARDPVRGRRRREHHRAGTRTPRPTTRPRPGAASSRSPASTPPPPASATVARSASAPPSACAPPPARSPPSPRRGRAPHAEPFPGNVDVPDRVEEGPALRR